MQSIILAINISSFDKISSSVSQLLVSALANEKISDIVIYLPKLEKRSFSTLCYLAAGIEDSGYLGMTHFLIPDEDKEEISLDILGQFKKSFPRVSVSSKDASNKIGDINFKYFNSDSLYSDELEDCFNEFYSLSKRTDTELCIVADSEKDANVLNQISSKFSVLKSDDVKAFRSRVTSDTIYLRSDLEEKIIFDKKISLEDKGVFYRKNPVDTNEKVMKKILEPTTKKTTKV